MDADRSGRVMIIGHRGASHVAPENTVAAVRRAWDLGADAVEVDVRLSRDGRLVVIHDATTGRTAGTDHTVATTSAEALRRLDVGVWRGRRFHGQRIPLLEEVLDTIPARGVLFVEVKVGVAIVRALRDAVVRSGKARQVVVIGFRRATMRAVKTALPDVPVCWLRGTRSDPSTGRSLPHAPRLVRLACEAGLDGLSVHHAGVGARFVTAVRRARRRLYTWTVNAPAEARRLADLAVDGITTDRPGWLRPRLAGPT